MSTSSAWNRNESTSRGIYYGWWIVVAAFLNLFFTTGVIYYGLPVFYASLVTSLGFSRAHVTQGFLLGFIFVGLPFGYLSGLLIDRVGARRVILCGVGFVGVPLILMGWMTHFWQYQVLCLFEVLGYVLAGPIANQVLIARWFRLKRGRAMGIAYLGLGLGGFVAPPIENMLIRSLGWRSSFEVLGAAILIVLFPIGVFLTRSSPEEMQLLPDGATPDADAVSAAAVTRSFGVGDAVKTRNFWLLLLGSALVIGAINTVIQHLILHLTDVGYSRGVAAARLSALLGASLAGRVLVGYVVDRFQKKNVMAFFYVVIGASIPLLLFATHAQVVWVFVFVFGFAMGADYMLIPLVTAECFGVGSLGKLLAVLTMGYSVGQWVAPWVAGRIFDAQHSYDLAWKMMGVAGVLGGLAVYSVRMPRSITTPS